MLSIPEKGFLLSFQSVFVFYLLGWQNFELTCTRIIFEFQKAIFFCIWTNTSMSIPSPVLITRIQLRFQFFYLDRFYCH